MTDPDPRTGNRLFRDGTNAAGYTGDPASLDRLNRAMSARRDRALWDGDWECSAHGCSNRATEVLVLYGQPGHIHDCPSCAAQVREFCDVIYSRPMLPGGTCPMDVCTPYDVHQSEPRPL